MVLAMVPIYIPLWCNGAPSKLFSSPTVKHFKNFLYFRSLSYGYESDDPQAYGNLIVQMKELGRLAPYKLVC